MKNSPHELFDDVMFQNDSVPGSVQSRYVAITIDTVLAGILVGLAIAFLKRGGVDDASLKPAIMFVWFGYHIILTWKFGQTVGKKIMKLQVVTKNGDAASFLQVATRETVGRMLAVPFGYVWAFFRKDRATWHDLISGTRVISIDPHASEAQMGSGKKFAITIGVLGTLSSLLIYVFFFTAVPLRQVAKNLELAGFEVEDVNGSIAFGPSVGRLAFADETSQFELNDVRLSYDLWAVFKNNRIIVKNLSVASGEFKTIAGVTNLFQGDKVKKKEPEVAKKGEREPAALLIERIDIANLKFVTNEKPFFLKRFYIDEFLFEKTGLSTNRIFIESDALDLDVQGLTANKTDVRVDQYLKGVARKSLFPKHLANDVTFEGKLDIDLANKEVRSLAMGFFDRRLQLRKEGAGFVMQSYGFTLSKYLLSTNPLSNANIQIRFVPPKYQPEVLGGQVAIRNTQFRYSKQYGFIHTNGPRAYAFKFEPSPMWVMMGPSFPISINQFQSEDDWLSQIYYSKPSAELTVNERVDVALGVRFFKPPVMMPTGFPQMNRMPSSSGGKFAPPNSAPRSGQ